MRVPSPARPIGSMSIYCVCCRRIDRTVRDVPLKVRFCRLRGKTRGNNCDSIVQTSGIIIIAPENLLRGAS
jgi:hypothetical protein